ncbi:hypothetical protein M3Y97_00769000 [Aphelenchoides bicaudatus]|nr:hypothetical protein M3Y97_00769000 [Aphelenchoides bicaudatus]
MHIKASNSATVSTNPIVLQFKMNRQLVALLLVALCVSVLAKPHHGIQKGLGQQNPNQPLGQEKPNAPLGDQGSDFGNQNGLGQGNTFNNNPNPNGGLGQRL